MGVRDGTCLTKKELHYVATENNIPVKKSAKKQTLVAHVSKAMTPKCGEDKNKETCWISHSSRKHTLEKAYRPKMPRAWIENPRTWLNTFDILHVMKQYDDRYKSFKFLGVHSIDFASNVNGTCIGDSLCTLHIRSLIEQKKKCFGMVLNLDKHDGPGFHWVALFCNFDPKSTRSRTNFGIYYYDSVAVAMDSHNKEGFTKAFVKKTREQIRELYGDKVAQKFEMRENKVRSQYKDTECGMFSQVFITQMLKNVPFDTICKHMPRDDQVQKIRNIIYS
jgi:hypothetical protein